MSGSTQTCPVSLNTVIANETSFFTWLNTGDRTCPTVKQVSQAIAAASAPTSSGSNALYNNEKKVKELTKRLENRKNDVQIAHDRASMVLRPELTASYYDGWFPIHRPLKQISVPILIGAATFLFTISFFMFLEFVGISNVFSVYIPFERNPVTNPLSKYLWVMTLIGLVFFALTLYLFLR